MLYENGACLRQDYQRAAGWCIKAANQGHAQAQLLLALMYKNGWGVEKDEFSALKWTLIAKKNGAMRADTASLDTASLSKAARQTLQMQIDQWFRKSQPCQPEADNGIN
jgi:TPR repeat protein